MNFVDRMKEIIRKSLVNKGDFPEQALERTVRVGQKCILYHEINELEKDVENKFLVIGNAVYAALIKRGKGTVSRNTAEIKDLLMEIAFLEKLISEKVFLLNKSD